MGTMTSSPPGDNSLTDVASRGRLGKAHGVAPLVYPKANWNDGLIK